MFRLISVILLATLAISACSLSEEDRQRLIETAIAAQDEAGIAAERATEALAEHTQVWAQVEAGPQYVAQVQMETAAKLEASGDRVGAEQFRKEAREGLNSHPLWIAAQEATAKYREAAENYSKADESAIQALEAVKAAGIWEQYVAATRTMKGY